MDFILVVLVPVAVVCAPLGMIIGIIHLIELFDPVQ